MDTEWAHTNGHQTEAVEEEDEVEMEDEEASATPSGNQQL